MVDKGGKLAALIDYLPGANFPKGRGEAIAQAWIGRPDIKPEKSLDGLAVKLNRAGRWPEFTR